MLTDDNIKHLLGQTVDAIKAQLPSFNPAELQRIDELERTSKNPRASLLKFIEEAAAASADKAGADSDAETGKAARGEEVKPPAYQSPDYNGPLTGEQAFWRNQNLYWKDGKLVRRK